MYSCLDTNSIFLLYLKLKICCISLSTIRPGGKVILFSAIDQLSNSLELSKYSLLVQSLNLSFCLFFS